MNENNKIRQSLNGVRATEEMKKNTLQYLLKKAEDIKPDSSTPKTGIPLQPFQRHHRLKYVLTAVCIFLFLGIGGYSVYRQPVSYISIDVNPSIELGINRFGRVVSADAYNDDGQLVLQTLSLKNAPYVQAIDTLLANESASGFLNEDSLLVFTVVSSQYASILENLNAAAFSRNYETCMYTSDTSCMEEAHRHAMSFGKYRGYQELSQYDASVTIEECHNMTMKEIHDRIESCHGHQGGSGLQHHGISPMGTPVPVQPASPNPAGPGHHGKCHKQGG